MALYLWQRKEGGNYYIRGTTIEGEDINETTRTNDKEAAEKLRIAREGKALSDKLNGSVKNCTFEQAALSYLKNGGEATYIGRQLADGTWTGLIGYFGDRIIRDISQDDLDDAGRVLYPDCQPQTVNRQCHGPFVAIYRRAHRNKFCEARDWARPKWTGGKFGDLVKREIKRRVGSFGVKYEHAARFVLAMSPANAMVMTALFYTGMRPSELFALDTKAVNIRERYINLDWNTKTSDPRLVPIHEMLVPMLTALVKRGGILFRTPRGEPYPIPAGDEKVSGQMNTAIRGTRARTGINDIAPYTARHSVSTELNNRGVTQITKDQILGHYHNGDPSWDYTHVDIGNLCEAINRLPVIEAWASAPWLRDPLAYATKLAEGTGRRTDLERLRVRREKRAKVNSRKKIAARVRKHRVAQKV